MSLNQFNNAIIFLEINLSILAAILDFEQFDGHFGIFNPVHHTKRPRKHNYRC